MISSASIFETLQHSVSLEDLAGRYTALQSSGDKLKGLCPLPDHADNAPSFYVYPDRRFHCFGCAGHGDVTDLWAVVRGMEPGIEAALDLAREYSVELPDMDPQARKRAAERRQREDTYLEQAAACHEALEKHARVAQWWESRGFGPELRERFLLGANRDGTAAVIPYWSRGRVAGLIRRNLEGEPKYLYPKAEDFAAGYRPLFIPSPARAGAFLVEGPVDALAVVALGTDAIAVGGAGIGQNQRDELRRVPGPIYILPDSDEAGAEAGEVWARDLYPEGRLCPAEYWEGSEDAADLFAAHGKQAVEKLKDLKAAAVDALSLELSEAPKGKDSLGAYRTAKERVLPLLLRLEDEGERDAALRDVAGTLKLNKKPLQKALDGMVEQHKEQQEAPEETADNVAPGPGTERYERAIKLLKSRRLLSRAAVDMKRLGHVGEYSAKKLAFICAASAKSGKPIQPSTHAQSSAGKNFLWDTALSLLPPEMVVKRSGLSAKALFRTQTDLKGAVLYLQEVAGSEEAEYTIRVLQSDGRLEYEATEKTPDGGMRNVIHQTEGPTVVVQTTTRSHLHSENETRVLPIYVDESASQTARIVSRIKHEAAGGGVEEAVRESITSPWHDAMRLLEPAEVVIPYAGRIEIPSSPLRIRRDARRLIDVVRVIAWLQQRQRDRDEEGRILAEEQDFNEALQLVSESLRRAWQTLTPAEEIMLRTIRDLSEQLRTRGFRRRDLKVKEVSDRRVKEVLKSLTDTGYLDCDGRAGPQGYIYTLAREAEKISLGISLRPPPDTQQIPAKDEDSTKREASARHRPVPDRLGASGDYRVAGANGRNDHRPVEDGGLQVEHPSGRVGGGERERKVSPDGRFTTSEIADGLRELFESNPQSCQYEADKLALDLYLFCDFDSQPPADLVAEVLKEVKA